MKALVVVDVGNTRIKWGLCQGDKIAQVATLSPSNPESWNQQAREWNLVAGTHWVITSVVPAVSDSLASWIMQRKDPVQRLISPSDLPLKVALERPERAGIDRLLDAVAANHRRPTGRAAILIDAGSAITVDMVDEMGVFRGGAILPGLRLMAKSLHEYTALLPQIEIPAIAPAVPGINTIHAMELGIFWAVTGGVLSLIAAYQKLQTLPATIFLTGGDGAILEKEIPGAILWPTMTLEGIRISAEKKP